jgi:hypothetical protein
MRIRGIVEWVALGVVMSLGGLALYLPTWQETEYIDAIRRIPVDQAYASQGLKFEKIGDGLYTLTGNVRDGDCEKIVPEMPQQFAVILESPGGSLSEGMCLASHIKLRDVITVVRDTPVINELGKIIYEPGLISKEGKVICASACGLLFLGGDRRHLIGNVFFGIHGPRTPEEMLPQIHKRTLEAQAYQTSVVLLRLLERLGVEDSQVRMAFLAIPSTSMYWLNPRDFKAKPELVGLATDYKNFWGLTISRLGVG